MGDIWRDNYKSNCRFSQKTKDIFKEKKIKLVSYFNTVHEMYQRAKRTKEHVISDQ